MQPNKYEYTRSIKTGLKFILETSVFPNNNFNQANLIKRIKELILQLSDLRNVINELKTVVSDEEFIKNNQGSIQIKKVFIRKFIDPQFKSQDNKILVTYLDNNIKSCLEKLLRDLYQASTETIDELTSELSKSQPDQSGVKELIEKFIRFPKIYYLQNRSISILSFSSSLFEAIDFTNKQWAKFVNSGNYKIIEENLFYIKDFLSKKKEVLKASFNRATVNKSYTSQDIVEKVKEISEKMNSPLQNYFSEEKLKQLAFDLNKIKGLFNENEQLDLDTDFKNITLQDAAIKLKKIYKNKIKKKFKNELEKIFKQNNDLNIDIVKRSAELSRVIDFIFNSKNVRFNEYFKRYLEKQKEFLRFKQEVERDSDEKIKKEKEEDKNKIIGLAQEAGIQMTNLLRRTPSSFIETKNNIAREFGKLKTQSKSLDNSRFFLSHFALLAFEKEKDFNPENTNIIFVPSFILKNKELQNKLNKLLSNSNKATHSIFELHSLTFNSLKNKLIAKNCSELIPYFNEEKYSENEIIFVLKYFLCRFFLSKDEKRQVEMHISNDIDDNLLKIFEHKRFFAGYYLPDGLKNILAKNIISPQHRTLEEFRMALEQNYYYLQKRDINLNNFIAGLKTILQENNIIYNWTNREKLVFIGETYFKNIKNRRYIEDFSDLLRSIKNGDFTQKRLNPEVTVYLEEKEKGDFHPNNRKNHNRFSIQFVYTTNKPNNIMNLRFNNDENILQEIEKFNASINEKIINLKSEDNYIRIGIDVGTQEFISATFFSDWSKNIDIKKQGFPFRNIEFYELKNLLTEAYIPKKNNGVTKIKLFQNPSYFINEDPNKRGYVDSALQKKLEPNDFLEKIQSHYIEFSTAKIIDNKIVLNGDIVSYIKLQLVPIAIKILSNDIDINLINNKNVQVNKRGSNVNLQCRSDSYQFVLSQEVLELDEEILKNIIKFVLTKIFEKDLIQFVDLADKIDYLEQLERRLAKTIASNAAAIFAFLIEQNSIGEIYLESEPEAFLIDHESKKFASKRISHSITREFSWALLKKLQKNELTPPALNRQFLLRQINIHRDENFIQMQFGIVNFIVANKTSILCPICLKPRRNKNAICDKCGFDVNKNNYKIPNPDILAACNIANPNIDNINNNNKKKKGL